MKKTKRKKKKSYNLFDMWGSYVGVFTGIALWFILGFSPFFNPIQIPYPGQGLDVLFVAFKSFSFYLFIIGSFLIGWGIHSLIRRYSK